jgi:spore coat polysaccharide biosynthesis protein SpsF
MLAQLINQVRHVRHASKIMVATTNDAADDAIEKFCAGFGISCYRGPRDDVAARLIAAAESVGAESFARISGDSPWIVPTVVDDVIKLYHANDVDLATNVQKRTFPKGLSVEAIRVSALRRAQSMMEGDETEHVTSVFYRRPQDFRIVNLTSGHDWGMIQMSIDTPADFALAERMLADMPVSVHTLSVAELVAIHARHFGELLS